MLITLADDKSKRLALLQDLQQLPLPDARQKRHLATRSAPKRITTAGENAIKSSSPLHEVFGLAARLSQNLTN